MRETKEMREKRNQTESKKNHTSILKGEDKKNKRQKELTNEKTLADKRKHKQFLKI